MVTIGAPSTPCLVVVLLFNGLTLLTAAQGFAHKYPIGAIIASDEEALHANSAFSFQLERFNEGYEDEEGVYQKPKALLQANTQHLRTQDAFHVNTAFCRHLANGVFTLFGMHNAGTINALRAFSRTFNMPLVTISTALNSSAQELGYQLYMKPLYTAAIVDLIKDYYGWQEIWYIYNSDEGLMRLEQLYDALTAAQYQLKIHVIRVRDLDDLWVNLKRIDSRREEDKRLVLDMSIKDVKALLNREIQQPRTVRHHYFVVELGVEELDVHPVRHGGMNITGFNLVDYDDPDVKRFMAKWEAGTTPEPKIPHASALAVDAVSVIGKALSVMVGQHEDAFKNALRNGKVYNNGTEGIDCNAEHVVPWQHGYSIMKALREISLNGLTGRVSFDKYGLRTRYRLEIMEVTRERRLAKVGQWHSDRGLAYQTPDIRQPPPNNTNTNRTRIVTSILTSPYLMVRNPDAEGNDKFEGYCADLAAKLATLIDLDYLIEPVKDGNYGARDKNGSWNGMVGELVRHTAPYLTLKNPAANGSERYEGYCADLIEKVAEKIGIKYEIRPVKDFNYGARDENGTWNGMVGELIRHEADLAIAPLTITSLRERVIDFSKPFMSLGISIMIKKLTKEAPGVFSFMYPLSYEIWMCVIFAYIGVSVVLFLVSRFSPFEWHIEDNQDGPSVTNNFTIFNSLWFSLGAFMQQGCDIEPRSTSGRIVGSVWWFFTLIIISSYTANLAAFLTVERMQSPIESADDLAKQTEIKFGTVDSGTTKEFFRTSSIQVYERMWTFMNSQQPSVFVKSNEEGVKRVRQLNGKYAFLTESTTNDYINQRLPCNTMKVGNNLDSKGYGIATPRGSDLRDQVTLAVLTLRENGDLAKLEKKWWYDKGECLKQSSAKGSDTTNALMLSNVAGIFYILIGGLMLALLMAALEFLYKSRIEAGRRQTSFTNAVRSKARLSIKGKPEAHRATSAVGQHPSDLPPNLSMSTYTYPPSAQLISLDGYAEVNTHTQV